MFESLSLSLEEVMDLDDAELTSLGLPLGAVALRCRVTFLYIQPSMHIVLRCCDCADCNILPSFKYRTSAKDPSS